MFPCGHGCIYNVHTVEGFEFCGVFKDECVGVEICWLVDEGDQPHAIFWVSPTCEHCLVRDDYFGGVCILEIDFVLVVHGDVVGVNHFACDE